MNYNIILAFKTNNNQYNTTERKCIVLTRSDSSSIYSRTSYTQQMVFSWIIRSFPFVFLLVHQLLTGESDGERSIAPGVFHSLEELSRIVDISYCVGNSGVRKPFQCLSRCDEFENFELIAVSYYLNLQCLNSGS